MDGALLLGATDILADIGTLTDMAAALAEFVNVSVTLGSTVPNPVCGSDPATSYMLANSNGGLQLNVC